MLAWMRTFGELRHIFERAFGVGPRALTEVVAMLVHNRDVKTA